MDKGGESVGQWSKVNFSNDSELNLTFGNLCPEVWGIDAHAITVLDWPVNWPDLNVTENLWGMTKWNMRATRFINKIELAASIKEIWASIIPRQCYRLIASMPRCIDAVIHTKRFPSIQDWHIGLKIQNFDCLMWS